MVTNHRDLGFEVYGAIAYNMADNISRGINRITNGKLGRANVGGTFINNNSLAEKSVEEEEHKNRSEDFGDDDTFGDSYNRFYYGSEINIDSNYDPERVRRIEEEIQKGAKMR